VEKLPILVVFFGLLLVPVGMDNAFGETRKVTFFDDGASLGTPNPLANGDGKTNDYADVVAFLANRGQGNTNIDLTEPGAFPPAEMVIFLDDPQSCFSPLSHTNPVDVFRGFEEGEFTFSGLDPFEKFQVTVILSDIDDCGLLYRLDANPNDPVNIPALETVFVRGNAVELGVVDATGLGQGDHEIQKTFTILAMPDGSGDLTIGFNSVFYDAGVPVRAGIGVEQIVIRGDDDADRQVGGELLPIETTSLLLAAAQSPAWLTALTIAALGIGAFVFTRNQNNIRNAKAILRYYLDRF